MPSPLWCGSYEDMLVVLPGNQLPAGLEGRALPHAPPDHDLRVVRLAAFERELWTTLQADLLFVLGTLLANKARPHTCLCRRRRRRRRFLLALWQW